MEELGIVFIDEIDKIVGSAHRNSADASDEGVQRDLLPIIEGTKVRIFLMQLSMVPTG